MTTVRMKHMFVIWSCIQIEDEVSHLPPPPPPLHPTSSFFYWPIQGAPVRVRFCTCVEFHMRRLFCRCRCLLFSLLLLVPLEDCALWLWHFLDICLYQEPHAACCSLLLLEHREGCAFWLWHFLDIFLYQEPHKETLHPCLSECAQWRFWSDCANVHDNLNRRMAHTSEGNFSDVMSD